MSAPNGKVTVTGPGVCEEKETPELGLSFAVTLASHAAHTHLEETFYVRLADGTTTGMTESFTDGSVSIYGREHFA